MTARLKKMTTELTEIYMNAFFLALAAAEAEGRPDAQTLAAVSASQIAALVYNISNNEDKKNADVLADFSTKAAS